MIRSAYIRTSRPCSVSFTPPGVRRKSGQPSSSSIVFTALLIPCGDRYSFSAASEKLPHLQVSRK